MYNFLYIGGKIQFPKFPHIIGISPSGGEVTRSIETFRVTLPYNRFITDLVVLNSVNCV